jgi:hypothetical protein
LHDLTASYAFLNLIFTERLIQIINAFEAKGIRAIPMKGLTLAAMAYGDLSLRYPGDLDLLIRPEDLPRAREVIADLGYEPVEPMTEAAEENYIKSVVNNQLSFRRDGAEVELHWKIVQGYYPFDVSFEELWERRTTVRIAQASIPALATDDLLLFLCVHGSKHCWSQLKWIEDVAELIRSQPEFDWTAMLQKAVKLRCARKLLLGLHLAQQLYGIDPPEFIHRAIQKDQSLSYLSKDALGLLFKEGDKSVLELRYLFHLRLIENFSHRIRYSRYVVSYYIRHLLAINEKDRQFLSVPHYLSFLYYILRPVRLFVIWVNRGRKTPGESAS